MFGTSFNTRATNRRVASTNPAGSLTKLVNCLLMIFSIVIVGTFQPRPICAQELRCNNLGPLPDPGNIPDWTKAAMARAWKQPCSGLKLLTALEVLTDENPAPLAMNVTVLDELTAADPADRELYQVAMGLPDSDGRPMVTGMANLLDVLATANTLGLKSKDKKDLFDGSENIVKRIGPVSLVRVYDSFHRNRYRALAQLLRAAATSAADENKGLSDMEKLRAAFEMDNELLQSQVVTRVEGKKKE